MERSSFPLSIHINLQESGNVLFGCLTLLMICILTSFELYLLQVEFVKLLFFQLILSFKYIYLSCSMTTPNGRFMTQKKICLSMSDCKYFVEFLEELVSYTFATP